MPSHPPHLCVPLRRALARAIACAGGAAFALGLIAPAGCARPLPDPALRTLRSYKQALDRDDPQAAYALLSPALQQSLPREQFIELWREQRPERLEQARQLGQLLDERGQLRRREALSSRALLTLPHGAQLAVVPAASSWRVLEPDLQAVRAQTPEDALRLLLLAVEQRSYPAVLRLLTVSERQTLEAELRERLERLRAALSRGQTPEVNGGRARLSYDPRFFIELKKEPDGWRVADFN